MSKHRSSVLMVGTGIGGLSMSAMLARRGVDSLLVEKRRATFVYPKARNLNFTAIKHLDTGVTSDLLADYLVAADGTHSPIRRKLGIGTSGFGQLPIFAVFMYFRAPWRQFVPGLGDGDGVQITNPNANGIFIVAKDDLGVFAATYFPSRGETVDRFTPQRCRQMLLAAIGAPIDVEIVDIGPWRLSELVADQFRCGRVFLVGDSAHTMPPFKGGAAKSAIESAHNLAWKLAAVLKGTADPELLDTYHAERHPVGRFAARQSLTGPAMSLLPLEEDRPTLPAEEDLPLFYMIAGYKYRSPAVVTDQAAPTDPDTVQLVETRGAAGRTRHPAAACLGEGRRCRRVQN